MFHLMASSRNPNAMGEIDQYQNHKTQQKANYCRLHTWHTLCITKCRIMICFRCIYISSYRSRIPIISNKMSAKFQTILKLNTDPCLQDLMWSYNKTYYAILKRPPVPSPKVMIIIMFALSVHRYLFNLISIQHGYVSLRVYTSGYGNAVRIWAVGFSPSYLKENRCAMLREHLYHTPNNLILPHISGYFSTHSVMYYKF